MENKNSYAAFLPNGEIDKRGIGRMAYTVMAPLVVAIRRTVSAPAPVMAWLQHTVTAVYNMGQAADFVDTLKLLYALVELAAPPNMGPFVNHPAAASRFMLSCLCVVEEMMEGAGPLAVD